ncbi:MAG: glycosyltransferase family 4 protein [Candidatus Methanomethylicia archaeon]
MTAILFIKPIIGLGGATQWLITVSRYLLQHNHEVTIAFSSIVPEAKLKVIKGDFNMFKLNSLKIAGLLTPMIFDIIKLAELISESDTVYVDYAPPNDILTLVSLRKSKLKKSPKRQKIILGFHTNPLQRNVKLFFYRKVVGERVVRRYSFFHVINRSIYFWLKKLGIDSNRIYFIPNFVDTEYFTIMNRVKSEDTFNILYVGRLEKNKGIHYLVEIIRRINESSTLKKNIRIRIAGSGSYLKSILNLSQKFRNVEYFGFVCRDLLLELYQSSHMLLFPSEDEVMPLSVLEAQSCGLPVVGFKCDGMMHIISNRNTGFLAQKGNTVELFELTKRIYHYWTQNTDDFKNWRERIRRNIVKNYDCRKLLPEIEKMLSNTYNT